MSQNQPKLTQDFSSHNLWNQTKRSVNIWTPPPSMIAVWQAGFCFCGCHQITTGNGCCKHLICCTTTTYIFQSEWWSNCKWECSLAQSGADSYLGVFQHLVTFGGVANITQIKKHVSSSQGFWEKCKSDDKLKCIWISAGDEYLSNFQNMQRSCS